MHILCRDAFSAFVGQTIFFSRNSSWKWFSTHFLEDSKKNWVRLSGGRNRLDSSNGHQIRMIRIWFFMTQTFGICFCPFAISTWRCVCLFIWQLYFIVRSILTLRNYIIKWQNKTIVSISLGWKHDKMPFFCYLFSIQKHCK